MFGLLGGFEAGAGFPDQMINSLKYRQAGATAHPAFGDLQLIFRHPESRGAIRALGDERF